MRWRPRRVFRYSSSTYITWFEFSDPARPLSEEHPVQRWLQVPTIRRMTAAKRFYLRKKSFSVAASISQGNCLGNRPFGLTRLINSGITFSTQNISIQPNPDKDTEHSPVTVSRCKQIEKWRYWLPCFLITHSRCFLILINLHIY